MPGWKGVVAAIPIHRKSIADQNHQRFAGWRFIMLDIDFNDSDEELREILGQSQVIAMVGESNDHYYTSYQVAQYLKKMGYKVYPVNPNITTVDGDRNYPQLEAVPEPIDIVDVFRKLTHLGTVVEEAIAVGP